jgi:hypothetical protein
MTPSRRGFLIAVLALASVTAGSALAQTPPTRIRGSIAGLDGATLSVVTREGPTVKIVLPDGLQPTALKRITIDAITPNSFVATVAIPAADGTLHSSYVAVFPESMRGVGEGHYDWDLAPGTSMTNATVTSIVSAKAGRKLTMVYKGTPIDIVVPDGTPIITNIPATRYDLKPGAKVFITAIRNEDGSYKASRITVGKDGVDPPQ